MSIRPLHLCAAVLLASLSSSCVFAFGTDDESSHPFAKLHESAVVGRPAENGVAAAGESGEGKDGKPAASPEAAKKKAERKAQKKARETTYARMELALAEMEAENDLRDAKFDVEHARQDLEAAQRELDHFQRQAKPLELEDSQLDVDRSIESALERQQELDELTSMYKKDEVAKMTKELVLQRGKKTMEFAQRELELDKKRAASKKEHDLTVKERDLTLAVAKAQQEAGSAEAKLKKVQAHNELELLRARHKLEDAERPDDDEGSADGESKGA
ncbi:MAG TPA: hypothetical protein VM509_16045 [Planctomycetota bacterium]|nr:hypothetical protein [Planctomycetota bacterium]